MVTLRRTRLFAAWLLELRDSRARETINVRLRRLENGNAGEVRSVGGGVAELKIDYGPGYRVYFTRRGLEVILLLCGGDKSCKARTLTSQRGLRESTGRVWMALETFPYDTAEFIKTPEDVFYYLEAEMEQNEPPYWAGAICIVARARGGFEHLAAETSLPVERLQLAADRSATPDRAMMVAVMEAYRPKDSSASRVA